MTFDLAIYGLAIYHIYVYIFSRPFTTCVLPHVFTYLFKLSYHVCRFRHSKLKSLDADNILHFALSLRVITALVEWYRNSLGNCCVI